jgi:hypothetical protein
VNFDSEMSEFILSSFNLLDEEYNELTQLEEFLLKTKQTYSEDFDELKRNRVDSVEINTNFSDMEDGYKSGNSCFSDTAVVTKTKKKLEKVSSVTIDLNNERKLKCFKMIKNKIK